LTGTEKKDAAAGTPTTVGTDEPEEDEDQKPAAVDTTVFQTIQENVADVNEKSDNEPMKQADAA